MIDAIKDVAGRQFHARAALNGDSGDESKVGGWLAGVGVGLLLVWYLEEKTTGFVSARV